MPHSFNYENADYDIRDDLENWQALYRCPECGHRVLIHIDKTYPGGELNCFECDTSLEKIGEGTR